MICEHCNKNEIEIHIDEIGDFCLDCYNKFVSETYDIETYDQYSKSLTVYDENDKLYRFEIIYELLPEGYCWIAKEIDGNYEFEVIADFDEDQQIIIKHLQSKIIKGLAKKSLAKLDNNKDITNALKIEGNQFMLSNVGSIKIEYDDDEEYCLVIDGKKVSFNEFSETISSYAGFVMDYQFRDISDEVLEKDMILRQFDINADKLYKQFEKRLNWFIVENFLDFAKEEMCYEALLETVDDLELSVRYGVLEKTFELSEKIISRLEEVEHNSDYFPDNIISVIHNIVG